VASGGVFVGRRGRGVREKKSISLGAFAEGIESMLAEIQQGFLDRAKAFRTEHTRAIESTDDFHDFFKIPGTDGEEEGAAFPIHGGFVLPDFNGVPALEEKIKQDLAVTVCCIPLDGQGVRGDEGEPGVCPFTGEKSAKRGVWAKSHRADLLGAVERRQQASPHTSPDRRSAPIAMFCGSFGERLPEGIERRCPFGKVENGKDHAIEDSSELRSRCQGLAKPVGDNRRIISKNAAAPRPQDQGTMAISMCDRQYRIDPVSHGRLNLVDVLRLVLADGTSIHRW